MDPLQIYLTIGLTALGAIAILAVTGLRAFSAWIDLKRVELGALSGAGRAAPIASRIDIADLKERIRKLEAIAAGVDL